MCEKCAIDLTEDNCDVTVLTIPPLGSQLALHLYQAVSFFFLQSVSRALGILWLVNFCCSFVFLQIFNHIEFNSINACTDKRHVPVQQYKVTRKVQRN